MGDNTVTVSVDDLRALLRDGVDWTDDHGPTARLADAVNATVNRKSCICSQRPAWGVVDCPAHGTVTTG